VERETRDELGDVRRETSWGCPQGQCLIVSWLVSRLASHVPAPVTRLASGGSSARQAFGTVSALQKAQGDYTMKKMIEKIVDDILELISAPFDIELQDIDYDDLAAEAAG
jgi:hypothetical protein